VARPRDRRRTPRTQWALRVDDLADRGSALHARRITVERADADQVPGAIRADESKRQPTRPDDFSNGATEQPVDDLDEFLVGLGDLNAEAVKAGGVPTLRRGAEPWPAPLESRSREVGAGRFMACPCVVAQEWLVDR
jgi:hypothetical protein